MNIVQSPYATSAYGGFGGAYGRYPQGTGVPGVPADSYFADPNVGPIAQNIGTALFGNPQMMRQNALSDAQIAQENARTTGLNIQNTNAQHQSDALTSYGSLFAHKNPDGTSRPITYADIQADPGTFIQKSLMAAGADPQKAAEMLRMWGGINGNPQALSNLFAGAGGAYTSTPVGQQVAQAGETQRTGISAGAGVQEANIHEAGSMARQTQGQQFGLDHPAPLSVSPGATVLIPPNARGYAGMGTPIPGAPVANPIGTETGTAPTTPGPSPGSLFTAPQRPYTTDQARADMEKARIDAMPPGPAKDAAIREFVSPSVVGTEKRGDAQRDVQNLKNAGKVDHPPNAINQGMIDSEVDSQLGSASFQVTGDAKNAIRARASELYGKGVAAPEATEQAIREFGAAEPPKAPGSFGNLFNLGKQQYGTPQGYGAAPQGGGIVPAQSAPAAPAPAQAAPGGIPAQPANVPPGSAYSPSRGMWRSPDGRVFDATGRPAS